jgi:hypothetical protein
VVVATQLTHRIFLHLVYVLSSGLLDYVCGVWLFAVDLDISFLLFYLYHLSFFAIGSVLCTTFFYLFYLGCCNSFASLLLKIKKSSPFIKINGDCLLKIDTHKI